MSDFSPFLIAAASSGSGKTTLSFGLLRALQKRGMAVQPFKCGPDYIDTKYHDLAAGNPSINLDTFLSTPAHVEEIFARHSSGKNISLVEGVMGLFDGYDQMEGSSAKIAELLDIPIILVINAKAMAYSAAALIYGFKNFYPNIRVKGAIFNFVSSETHYNYLREACEVVGVEPLGFLPPNKEVEIPSRHLGLTLDSEYRFNEFIEKVADMVEKHIDIDRLLEITQSERPAALAENTRTGNGLIKISVARDKAFNFTYHENIEYLKRLGEVTFFSPIADNNLPQSDLVYLPGGYPELFLEELAGNESMKEDIRNFVENGGKILAECGGMMYMCRAIADKEGNKFPMVGILPQEATMNGMRLTLGYRYFSYNGIGLRGHEFHYSTVIDGEKLPSQAKILNAKGNNVPTKLFRYKNLIAGYTHIYWAEIDLLKLFDEPE
jgi:cobyrinic acid a,c-diamide synthase